MDEKEFDRPVYSTDNYDYTYSWFKANSPADIYKSRVFSYS